MQSRFEVFFSVKFLKFKNYYCYYYFWITRIIIILNFDNYYFYFWISRIIIIISELPELLILLFLNYQNYYYYFRISTIIINIIISEFPEINTNIFNLTFLCQEVQEVEDMLAKYFFFQGNEKWAFRSSSEVNSKMQ